jgi:transposase-like protein
VRALAASGVSSDRAGRMKVSVGSLMRSHEHRASPARQWRRWARGLAGRRPEPLEGARAQEDAEAFDAEIKRRSGPASSRRSRPALQEFAEEWWHVHAVPNLSRRTREVYASLWDLHVLPASAACRCGS